MRQQGGALGQIFPAPHCCPLMRSPVQKALNHSATTVRTPGAAVEEMAVEAYGHKQLSVLMMCRTSAVCRIRPRADLPLAGESSGSGD
jgi:hypothetical protein